MIAAGRRSLVRRGGAGRVSRSDRSPVTAFGWVLIVLASAVVGALAWVLVQLIGAIAAGWSL